MRNRTNNESITFGVVAGYARLSTKEQNTGITLEQQINQLKQGGATKIFQDIQSGRKTDRAQLNKLLEEASQGRISKVIVTRLDRLSRKSADSLRIIDGLLAKNIQVDIINCPIDNMTNPTGRLTLKLQATLAEYEVNLLAERIRNGHQYQRDLNIPHGSVPPFGYVIIKEGNNRRFVLDTEPTELGKTKAEIAREYIEVFIKEKNISKSIRVMFAKYAGFKIFISTGALKNWLINPVLRGHVVYHKSKKLNGKSIKIAYEDWDVRENMHPDQKIMSEEEFQLIYDILKTNQNQRGGTLQYMSTGKSAGTLHLSGLMYCSVCGKKMTFRTGNGGRYIFCRNSNVGCTNTKCPRVEVIENQVIRHIFNKALNYTEPVIEKSSCLIELEEQLESINNLLKTSPKSKPFIVAKDSITKQLEEERKASGNRSLWDLEAIELITHPELKNITFLFSLSNEHIRLIYHKLISAINIQDGNVVEIKFNI